MVAHGHLVRETAEIPCSPATRSASSRRRRRSSAIDPLGAARPPTGRTTPVVCCRPGGGAWRSVGVRCRWSFDRFHFGAGADRLARFLGRGGRRGRASPGFDRLVTELVDFFGVLHARRAAEFFEAAGETFTGAGGGAFSALASFAASFASCASAFALDLLAAGRRCWAWCLAGAAGAGGIPLRPFDLHHLLERAAPCSVRPSGRRAGPMIIAQQ